MQDLANNEAPPNWSKYIGIFPPKDMVLWDFVIFELRDKSWKEGKQPPPPLDLGNVEFVTSEMRSEVGK